MNVILADMELEYISILKSQLQVLLPDIGFSICQSDFEIENLIIQANCSQLLILFNPLDFPSLDQRLPSKSGLNVDYGVLIYGPANSVPTLADHHYLLVYDHFTSVTRLAAEVRKWARQLPAADVNELYPACQDEVADKQRRKYPVPEDRESCREPVCLHMLICARPEGYRPDISRIRLQEMVAKGRRLIYLPLMPTYQMNCLAAPGQGPSLSDLLLQLMSRSLKPDDLGQFWQPHPNGFLQFRPPDRSDDLQQCPPDLLRQLVTLLRKRLSQDSPPGMALIDCSAMPFASMAAVAVLCDVCEVLMPKPAGYAAESACREIGFLLAKVPSNCKIIERIPENINSLSYQGKDGHFASGYNDSPEND